MVGLVFLALFAPDLASGQTLGPLSEQPGDARRGEMLLRDMGRVSCLICHTITGLPEKDQGQIGPVLDGVADAYDAGTMRQRIVDARVLNSDTMMPPYFAMEGLFGVAEKYQGRTIYTAQEVEDVLAYLMTLSGTVQK